MSDFLVIDNTAANVTVQVTPPPDFDATVDADPPNTVLVAPAPPGVYSVNGQTGIVNLVPNDIGLGNVDNTSDANKLVSTAQQTALNLKADIASPTFTGTVSGIDKTMVGLGNVDNTSDANKPVSTAQQTALNLKVDTSAIGAANGVAGLDGGGKVPASQLPITLMDLRGPYDASINSPALIDGVGDPGDVYEVTVAGTQNFGSGAITFKVGDWVIYAAGVWYKSINSNEVTSVAGKVGAVVLVSADVGLGNVDNTSDANKPVSTAQQTALNLKEDVANKDTDAALTANSNTRYPSQQAIKSYVDTINTSPANTLRGNNTGSPVAVLNLSPAQVTAMLANMVGDSGSGGIKGLVPAPAALDTVKGKVLTASGEFSANFPGATPSEAVRAVSTWAPQNATEANQWIDVVYAPDLRLFCAIASSGTNRVMTSSDGVTWAPYASSEQNLWTSVCWSPELNLFVAVSFDGTNRVMTSSDGQTWTPRVAAAANNWYRVVWAPALGLFVATALSGTINDRVMTSPDGINWTPRTASTLAQWYSLDWSPQLNLLVAVSLGGSIMTSPDGINWTTQTSPGTQDWYDIAWSKDLGIFAAVAITGGSRVMTSPDGINWTNRTAAAAHAWRRIVWAPHLGLFISVSSNGTIMTSSDGITWTLRTSPQANQWYGISWSFDFKVCVITGITGTNRVLNSTYVGGFQTGGLPGPTGPTGATGSTGATGPANPTGAIPAETVEQNTPQNSSSGTYVDIPGLTLNITTTTECKIRGNFSGTFSKSGGPSVAIDVRMVVDAQNGNGNVTTISGSEFKEASAVHLATSLPAGTYTVKVQWKENTGSGTMQLDRGTLVAVGLQASAPYSISQAVEYYDDWISPAVAGRLAWTSTVSGTGAANTIVTTNQAANQAGIVQFSTGTTATGRAALALGTTNHFFGGGVATFEKMLRIPTLSTGAEEFSIRAGLGDVVTGADFVDGVYFEYNRPTSVNWLLKTANNSVRSATDSGVAVVAGAWIKLKAVVNNSGTLVSYYINDTLVGTVATNIPVTVARVSAPTLVISKTVGVTARTMLVDYFSFQQVFTTPR